MSRRYRHIKEYETDILELKANNRRVLHRKRKEYRWYWSELYVVSYEEVYGKDVPSDWGQYQFESTLENLEHRIKIPDWDEIATILSEIHNSECNCIDCKTKRWKV